MSREKKYECPDQLERRVRDYFEELNGEIPTLAGLCLYLGFADKQSFSHYARYGGEFSLTVSRAKLRIEADRSRRLADKDSYTPGLPMDLRVNHGWVDPQKHEISGRDGKPIATMDLTGLTDDQLAAIERALEIVAGEGGGEGGDPEEGGEEGA